MVRDISHIKLPQIMRFVEEGLAASFLSVQNYEFHLVDDITGKKIDSHRNPKNVGLQYEKSRNENLPIFHQ